MTEWQGKLKNFFNHSAINAILAFFILTNIFALGFATSPEFSESYGHILFAYNAFILFLFTAEILFRVLAHPKGFFKDIWNVFDFTIIALALINFGGVIQVFRIFRLIWILRIFSLSSHIKHLVEAFVHAIPKLLSVAGVLFFALYVTALIGTVEFGKTVPIYGTLFTSFKTLSKLTFMPHMWSEHYEVLAATYPHAWAFVFPAMFLLSYLSLHLVIAVVTTSLHVQYTKEVEKDSNHLSDPDPAQKTAPTFEGTQPSLSSQEKTEILSLIEKLQESLNKKN